jgi:PTH2 family peptidyl-tRNA hydrolase
MNETQTSCDYGSVIYILVRSDLKMTKGKIGAQCGHAVEYLLEDMCEEDKKEYKRRGSAKICLAVTAQELESILAQVSLSHIRNKRVVDAGRTQVAPDTTTCLGIGPVEKPLLTDVIGHLKLL